MNKTQLVDCIQAKLGEGATKKCAEIALNAVLSAITDAVATDKDYRGQGYAKRLLAEAAACDKPVFLRPMSPSLFAFYESAGFLPFSPHTELCGEVRAKKKIVYASAFSCGAMLAILFV